LMVIVGSQSGELTSVELNPGLWNASHSLYELNQDSQCVCSTTHSHETLQKFTEWKGLLQWIMLSIVCHWVYFIGLNVPLLQLQMYGCTAIHITDTTQQGVRKFSPLYFIKRSPYRKMFQIKVVDLRAACDAF